MANKKKKKKIQYNTIQYKYKTYFRSAIELAIRICCVRRNVILKPARDDHPLMFYATLSISPVCLTVRRHGSCHGPGWTWQVYVFIH